MRLGFCALGIFILLSPYATVLAAEPWKGLVPCGGTGQDPCDKCHFVVLINNLVNFGIYNLALPLGGLMILVAGTWYALSGGDEKRITAAKNTLTNAALGIFVVLIAWFLVDTAIKALVNDSDATQFITALGPWNDPFEGSTICPVSSTVAPVPIEAEEPESAITIIATTIANIFGTVIMAMSVILILLAAFRFTTAGGNKDSVGVARTMLIYALVGVAVALFAFVMPALVQQVLGGSGGGGNWVPIDIF